MEEQKNPHSYHWRMWIITATMIIQLLTAAEYYCAWKMIQNSADLQNQALQYQVECMKNLNRVIESFVQ